MLSGLNALIGFINILDVSTYWFAYTPQNYESMKQLVHEGTYLLIFCILLSASIALYLFRGNQNFYRQNKLLKNLTILWLAQNILMVFSVAWRNYWYIQNYNMAYKRIGVLVFLAATVVGIITVIIKIRHKKTLAYVVRVNSNFIIAFLLILSCINWDYFITRFNLQHKNTAYIHKNFLIGMDESVLPLLLQHPDVFKNPVELEPGYMHLNENLTYWDIIEEKKKSFVKKYEQQSWLGWNLKDQQTYSALQ